VGIVEEMLEAQKAAIGKLQSRLGVRQRRIIGNALLSMARELKQLHPGSWTFAQRALVMRLLSRGFVDLVGKQTGHVTSNVLTVAKQSARLTAFWLRTLDKKHLGQAKPLRFDTLDWWTRKSTEVNRARVRMYSESFRRYGASTVNQIENEIAKVVLLGEPWEKARAKVWAATRKVVGDNQWMVDRIIRTEVSAVHNATAVEALREEDTDPSDPIFKVLIATFDQVTGKDSIAVHGQRRRIDEYFQDDRGRRYMAPPNRPHDREIVAGWRSSYGPFAAARRPTKARKAMKSSRRKKAEKSQITTPAIASLEAMRAVTTAEIEGLRRSMIPPLAISGTPEQIAALVDANFAAMQRLRMLQGERKQLADSIAKLRAAEEKRLAALKVRAAGSRRVAKSKPTKA
jgi:hypothetical protein